MKVDLPVSASCTDSLRGSVADEGKDGSLMWHVWEWNNRYHVVRSKMSNAALRDNVTTTVLNVSSMQETARKAQSKAYIAVYAALEGKDT